MANISTKAKSDKGIKTYDENAHQIYDANIEFKSSLMVSSDLSKWNI